MPRLSVPLTDEQHKAIKVKSAQAGIPQAEVARRLLAAWVRGDLEVPDLAYEYEWTSPDGKTHLYSGRRFIDWGKEE